ncbi:MAG: asparaginase [Sphingobium sp.]
MTGILRYGRHHAMQAAMLLALLFFTTNPVWAQNRPHVLVIATGGTIASTASGPGLTGDALVSAIPGLDAVARLQVEDLAAGGSSGLKRADWARLVRRIRAAFADDPALAGIVVTHGTDTLEETAMLLDLVIADTRPVVLTGSMRSSEAVSADGPANLLEAVRVAADPQARGRGTLVALDGQILSAGDAAKLSTSRTSAFASPNQGAIGAVLENEIRFFQPAGRNGRIYDLSPERIEALPRVDIVQSYLDGDGALADAAVAAGAKGLVVAGFGSGTLAPPMRSTVKALAERGFPVVLSARVASGAVKDSGLWDGKAPAAFERSGFLNPAKARVLLMVHLAAGGTGPLQAAFAGR